MKKITSANSRAVADGNRGLPSSSFAVCHPDGRDVASADGRGNAGEEAQEEARLQDAVLLQEEGQVDGPGPGPL